MQTKIVKTVAIGGIVSIALAGVAFTPAAQAAPAHGSLDGLGAKPTAQVHTNPHLATLPEPVREEVSSTM